MVPDSGSGAGFDHVAVVQVGDPDRFFEAWGELRPRLQD
jgi:hypothetical protein